MAPDAVLRALGSSRRGLSVAEAARRHAELPAEGSTHISFRQAIASELVNPLTPVLAVGAGLAAAVGSVTDAGLVAGVTAANALVGGVQRVRADTSIDKLMHEMTTRVDVRRGGRIEEMERIKLVRGDVLELKAGDMVPADCRILETHGCEVDESALTGESFPVLKDVLPVTGTSLAERSCMLYEGSVVATGTVLAAVVAVRDLTEVGRSLADAPEPPASGVEARLSALTKLTVPATIASGAAVAGMSLLRGRSPRAAASSGVSLMVAAVPEGLPLLATVAQLAAAHRLAERGALVRNPRTIEALGRVDVLCFDKTGTLTAGHIALQRVSDGSTDEPVGVLSPRSVTVLAAALRASPIDDGDDLPHATDRAVSRAQRPRGCRRATGSGDGVFSVSSLSNRHVGTTRWSVTARPAHGCQSRARPRSYCHAAAPGGRPKALPPSTAGPGYGSTPKWSAWRARDFGCWPSPSDRRRRAGSLRTSACATWSCWVSSAWPTGCARQLLQPWPICARLACRSS